jgi:hypothetical protein
MLFIFDVSNIQIIMIKSRLSAIARIYCLNSNGIFLRNFYFYFAELRGPEEHHLENLGLHQLLKKA